MLGAFTFHSGKADRLHNANQGKCMAYMFVMRVQEELLVWPEAGQRGRIWVSSFTVQQLATLHTLEVYLFIFMCMDGASSPSHCCEGAIDLDSLLLAMLFPGGQPQLDNVGFITAGTF
jgi:hypothetical protein